jgi:glycosyltransferase involved in cell wall biosynthesis
MLNYEYPPLGGGASPITGALAQQLAAADHDVDVVTMEFHGLPRFEQHGRLRVYRVAAVRHSQVRAATREMLSYLPSALSRSLTLTRQHRYDLIHSHFVIPTSIVAALLRRLCGLPSVITVHGSDVPGYNPDRFKLGHRVMGPVWRGLVRDADAIISPSSYLRNLLTASCAVPVDVIPYGFAPPPTCELPRRKRILFASRLFPRKGAHFLLDALAGLPLDGWEVVIAGDGPTLPDLQAQAARLGLSVSFRGFVKGEALEELYATSAIFVFPSLRDNFPVVLLEALSAGCAVITSDVSGMPEVVGNAGLLVPPGDVEAIRAAVWRLMEDAALRADLGAQARARMDVFAWDVILARHVALYERVVRRGKRALLRGQHANR